MANRQRGKVFAMGREEVGGRDSKRADGQILQL